MKKEEIKAIQTTVKNNLPRTGGIESPVPFNQLSMEARQQYFRNLERTSSGRGLHKIK